MKTKKKFDGCVAVIYTRQRIGKRYLCRECVWRWMERAELKAQAEAPTEYALILTNEAWERLGVIPKSRYRGGAK